MSRWNLSHVVYYSQHGQNRILEFEPNEVTIITGASRTGKTYIIETIDYCLCASSINLSNLIKKKVSCVCIKLVKDNTELLIAREISQKSSSTGKMYIEIGNSLNIPVNIGGLKGKINEDQARVLLAERFGLVNFKYYDEGNNTNISNVSIRQLVPYLFLSKEVIDSKKIILHGLDDVNAAKHIIASLPYFLNAIDIEELQAIKKLKGLKRGIEAEKKKKTSYEQDKKKSKEKSQLLYTEAIQVGILEDKHLLEKNDSVLHALRAILRWQPSKIVFKNEKLLNSLQVEKATILSKVNTLRRKKSAAIKNKTINMDFKTIADKQAAKLEANNFFKFDNGNCPICNSTLEVSKNTSKKIKKSFDTLRKESLVVDEHKPKLDGYIIDLEYAISHNITLASELELKIKNLIKESDIARSQKEYNNMMLRVQGRISYFLDNHIQIDEFDTTKLEQYITEFEEINNIYGIAQRAEKIQEAERFISNIATKNLSELPLDEYYKKNSINFNSKKPTIDLYNNDSGEVEKFPSIGSDENYLSIHIALIFALHKFFEIKKSPVPGFIIIDQVSRPYYPKDDPDLDIIDEDREALEKHFKFIFEQVAQQKGLQVIVLEHAYLHKNDMYKNATKYKWPREGKERLIPSDWPDFKK